MHHSGGPMDAAARFEWLFDRWADLTRWPTAKKTALAMGVALTFHLVVPALVLVAFAWWAPGLVDVPRLARFFVIWGLVVMGMGAVSLTVAWRGREGRWTVYMLIVGYGTSLAVMMSLMGHASSPWYSIVPLIVIFIALYFDARAG